MHLALNDALHDLLDLAVHGHDALDQSLSNAFPAVKQMPSRNLATVVTLEFEAQQRRRLACIT